jgi:hypothetical protein
MGYTAHSRSASRTIYAAEISVASQTGGLGSDCITLGCQDMPYTYVRLEE